MAKQSACCCYLIIEEAMVWNPPNLEQLQQQQSYTGIFLLTLLWNIGLYGLGTFAAFLVFLILKQYHLHQHKQIQMARESLLTQSRSSRQSEAEAEAPLRTSTQIKNSEEQITEGKRAGSSRDLYFKVINFLTSLTFYVTLVLLSALYLSFYIFGELGYGTGHDILAVILMFFIVALPTLFWKRQTRQRQGASTREVVFTIVVLGLWLSVAVVAVITLKGVCICIFNNKYGAKIPGDWVFSTEFSRSEQLGKVCQNGKVCHIYATLPETASDAVFINLHTGIDVENVTVNMQTAPTRDGQLPGEKLTLISTTPIKMHDIEYIGQRNVYSFYFSGLKPATRYWVEVKDSENRMLEMRNYTTPPSENADELRLAVGGDVGIDDEAYILTSNLVKYDPHVIIIGGDIAYDDGMRNCFYSWDSFYDLFDEFNRNVSRLVPLVLSVGNHDVGYNALANVRLDFSDISKIPYFFLFNPQHRGVGESLVPEPKDRLSFHYHLIGPTVHAHLDSGYIYDFKSQRSFIEKVSSQYPTYLKFANYHNPIYPSCTDSKNGSNDRNVIEEGLKNWTPLFDGGNFVAAFEHHTHHRKITYRLQGNKLSKEQGVRYVGDGSWGVPEGACPEGHGPPSPELFESFEKEHPNHIWQVRVTRAQDKSYSIEYKAVDLTGKAVIQVVDKLL